MKARGSRTRGADARQTGAAWRRRGGVSRAPSGLPRSWSGQGVVSCEGCGADIPFEESEIGTTKICECGHRLRLREVPSSDPPTAPARSTGSRLWVLGALVLLALPLFYLPLTRKPPSAAPPPEDPPSATFQLPEQAVEEVLTRFYSAATVDEIREVIRHPDTLNRRLQSWYATHPLRPAGFRIENVTEGTMSTGAVSAPGQIWGVAVILWLEDEGKPRSVLLERVADGSYKIDWEIAVHESEERLESFLATRSTIAEPFRVSVSRGDYYNFDFADEDRWTAYSVQSESGQFQFHAYARKDSEADRALQSWYYPGEKIIPVILTLRFPAGGREGQQVEILRAHQKNWMEQEK